MLENRVPEAESRMQNNTYLNNTYCRSGNFRLKNNLHENFCVNFSQFRSIRNFFLTVDNYNMDERLESLVYYRVSGETEIAGCSRRSNMYPGGFGLVRISLLRLVFIHQIPLFTVFHS